MSNDLDNLMKKLNKSKAKIEEPEEEEEVEEVEEEEEQEEDDGEDEGEDIEEEEELDDEVEQLKKGKRPKLVEEPKNPINKKKEILEKQQAIIEHELMLLQNPAVYRREKLALGREHNDLLKIIAQTLLEAKKVLVDGGDDGKSKKK